MTSALATTYPAAGTADPTCWLPARTPASDGRKADQLSPGQTAAPGPRGLPPARTVLAVTARPGPESTVLGGLLYAFGEAGARVTLLSMTRGEASPFNSTTSRLEAVRPWELQLASWLLGISSVAVADYPDGRLSGCPMPDLTGRVRRAIAEEAPDLILVLDPVAGNSDDARVARAVSLAARPVGVPVVARTTPGASDGWLVELGAEADVAREVQRAAARAHASQREALPDELRSMDSLSDRELLRWLVPAAIRPPAPREAEPCLN
jgi:LmbE family N-acetylglucosaminyl deacetylase